MLPFSISHFLDRSHLSEREQSACFEHFAELGLTRLSLTGRQSLLCLENPAYLEFLIREQQRNGIIHLNAHAPFGEQFDLNCTETYQRTMLETQCRLLGCCARLGVDTITFHVGTTDSGLPLQQLRSLTCRALEQLLPEAEKLGLTLLLENTFFPTDTPAELLGYLQRFPTPTLGICFDAGHANVMDATPGKRSDQLIGWIRKRWTPEVRFEIDTLARLLPHVVSCHLHDNSGFDDEHRLPGDGTIDWPRLFSRLEHGAPRLRSVQNETNNETHRITPEKTAGRFRELFRMQATVA